MTKHNVPTPWYVPIAIANFGLLLVWPTVYTLYRLAESWVDLQPSAAIKTRAIVLIAVLTATSLAFALFFICKALRVRKQGLDVSGIARFPYLYRFLCWLSMTSCVIALLTVLAQSRSTFSPANYVCFAYLFATALGMALTGDFATRAALRIDKPSMMDHREV